MKGNWNQYQNIDSKRDYQCMIQEFETCFICQESPKIDKQNLWFSQ